MICCMLMETISRNEKINWDIFDMEKENSISSSSVIHDPIEDTAEYKAIVDAVDKEANERVKKFVDAEVTSAVERYGQKEEAFIRSLPTFHRFCHEKKKILREKYGIEWRSVIEMNPHIVFG